MTALADQALADFAAREGISIEGAAGARARAERSAWAATEGSRKGQ